MSKRDKRILIVLGSLIILLIIILIVIITHAVKRNQAPAIVYTESTASVVEYMPLENEPILLSTDNEYESLYGTGTFTVSDEVFNEYSIRFYGPAVASDDQMKEQIVSLRNSCRNGDFDDAYYNLQDFSTAYSLTDGPLARELVSFYQFMYCAKDVSTLEENGNYDGIQQLLDQIDDPELFLILTMTLDKPYKFYLDSNSICLDTVVGIEGTGTLLPTDDTHYSDAQSYLTSTPLAVYRFPLRYNHSMKLFAYVVTDSAGNNHILNIVNEDGSYTSPLEQQAGGEYRGYDNVGDGMTFDGVEEAESDAATDNTEISSEETISQTTSEATPAESSTEAISSEQSQEDASKFFN